MPRSFVPLWTDGSQFPGLPLQQVLDKVEVSGRVSTFPRGGGSSIWVYTRCCETSGWRADCASVFFSHLCFLQKDLPHQASQGSVPVVSWPFSELGYLEGGFRDEASFLAFRRLFNFWTRHPGTAEGVFCAVSLALWFCASTSTLLQEGPGSPVLFMQSASETAPYSNCSRLPPAATKPVRSSSSFAVESLLRRAAVKLPAPGNKPDTGEDGCHFEACNSSASSQCWPRCAPQGLLLLWGALERLSSLAGEAFPQGPDLSSGQGADWDTVDSGSEEQANVLSPNTVSTLVRLHVTVATRMRWLCYGCGATATALLLVFVTVLVPTGSGSPRSDGSRALTTSHPYGPSLVSGVT